MDDFLPWMRSFKPRLYLLRFSSCLLASSVKLGLLLSPPPPPRSSLDVSRFFGVERQVLSPANSLVVILVASSSPEEHQGLNQHQGLCRSTADAGWLEWLLEDWSLLLVGLRKAVEAFEQVVAPGKVVAMSGADFVT